MKFSACTSGYSHGQKKVELQSTLPRTLMANCSFRRGSSWTLALALWCMCIKKHAKTDLVHFTDHVDVSLFFLSFPRPSLTVHVYCKNLLGSWNGIDSRSCSHFKIFLRLITPLPPASEQGCWWIWFTPRSISLADFIPSRGFLSFWASQLLCLISEWANLSNSKYLHKIFIAEITWWYCSYWSTEECNIAFY